MYIVLYNCVRRKILLKSVFFVLSLGSVLSDVAWECKDGQ